MSPTERETTFTALFEAHVDAVRAYAWRRDPATADDVVAETFLVAWRRLEQSGASSEESLAGARRTAPVSCC